MTTRDYKLNLWNDFMKETTYIKETDQEIMGNIALCYADDSSFLFQVYEVFIGKGRYLEDPKNKVCFEREEDEYILSLDGKECVYERETFRKVLSGLLDLLEDMLPLGTVVDLKKSAYSKHSKIQDVEELRMVVTYRFLGKEAEGYYFPYAGVVYPTGMMGQKEILYFTKALVDKIVYLGYKDEKEDAFVYLMKKELVVEKGINSFEYASEEELNEQNKMTKGGRKGNWAIG